MHLALRSCLWRQEQVVVIVLAVQATRRELGVISLADRCHYECVFLQADILRAEREDLMAQEEGRKSPQESRSDWIWTSCGSPHIHNCHHSQVSLVSLLARNCSSCIIQGCLIMWRKETTDKRLTYFQFEGDVLYIFLQRACLFCLVLSCLVLSYLCNLNSLQPHTGTNNSIDWVSCFPSQSKSQI